MVTRYGEMIDMISCLAVYNGSAKLKKKKTKRDIPFEEIIEWR